MLMSNLFSIFDPSLSILSFSWLEILFLLLLLPSFMFLNGYLFSFIMSIILFFKKEIHYTFPSSVFMKGVFSFFISLLFLIYMMNFMALFPYVFSLTSHLIINFSFSYSLWTGVILFNLTKFFKDYLLHFIPLGTPIMLMSFMSVVEFLSNMIRPLALTFRLTANMMAGHLLMSLIVGFLQSFNIFLFSFGYLFQTLLTFMEMGVSFIQTYVFFVLLLLYLSEGNF